MEDVLQMEFEKFRKLYKGAKRGHLTEFTCLKKKHLDWRQVIPLLVAAYESQLDWREKAKQANQFVPEHANLQTWLNQRRWEMEMPEIIQEKKEEPKKNIDPQFGYDTSKPGHGKLYNANVGKFLYPSNYTGEKV